MASLHQIPRFLLPRGPFLLRTQSRAFPPLQLPTPLRYASSSSAKSLSEEFRRRQAAQQQKTPVIPQPDKFRPPSHKYTPKKNNVDNKVYGPPLTEQDKKRMATKKYPNMMSPEGTFSHWFFNNRAIHLWITMGILVSLSIAAWYMDFMSKTIYSALVPSRKDFFRHPIESTNRFIEVYKMHMEHTSQVYSQQRLKKAEDVEKRKQYRLERRMEAEARGETYEEDPRYYIGEDGVRRRRVKRWLGIWE